MALSGPQLKFCQGILKGLNQTQAYMKAYPKCSAKAAESKASRAVRNGKISEYLEKAREKAEKRFEVSKDDAMRRLWEVANMPESVPQSVSAISQISKMQGWDKPHQVELTVNPLRKLLDDISGKSTGL